jgi:flagellar secretion chaperone FliS
MMPNPYQQYQNTQIQTASTGDLILLLYDGAIRFLNRAVLGIEEKRLDTAHADIVRGQDIVLELMTGLDFERGGELAVNLRELYLFMYQTLLQANLKKDVEKIHTVIRLLDNVRGAWQVVVRGEAGAPVAALAGGRAA